MQLSSTAFEDNGMIPAQYTCDGENTSPPLVIEDVPADAGSLALVVHDPDAPAGDWAHWLVWNIPPDTSRIGAGALPERAVQGITDFRVAAWGGPCPPNGEHRYIFTVYALDRSLDLPAKSRKADLERALEGNVVGTAQLVGRYSRS
ncbi:MAG: YbhB/YbcL family Raf kinase inhibitor-like protein [Candidatus Andersenbacteria bacterium CG10_big_fil_rev_8_21_14_0_10_54_11]|uniref:YbhB/YbcL family Raf kinase inhibitor-like protein n=1 Tax=Candidatus Andersenbacteria bacterium CG10_big_fil_rev_8_21_14_0_10_54_11 TaxID=1974485 RepID=A0A2M6WZE4_9BACT|nr:MAG: YbhB/YbcL family Raf kinase inhibitor-like protein [Candidatus Andersenbacteria bacterium CG10_big_fil_rev_8_21_14_0_10_54_11]